MTNLHIKNVKQIKEHWFELVLDEEPGFFTKLSGHTEPKEIRAVGYMTRWEIDGHFDPDKSMEILDLFGELCHKFKLH